MMNPNMSSSDITSLAQWKVNPGDSVVSCVNASLMQGWVRSTRYLAIVSNGCSSALFVLTSSNIPPTTVQEINIERIVPFDLNFRCDLESEDKEVGPDLFLEITHQKLILLFELDLGDKSNMFVAELYKATEKVNRGNGFLEFGWLQKYNPSYKIEPSEEDVERHDALMDSPELSINRESIAKGASLIARREAVIKYQMSKKEQDYTYKHSFRIFVGTWNVNGQPPTVSLLDWLACDIEPPDVYAVGFQELDLSNQAYVFADSPREDEWRIQVEKGLHQGAKYFQVALIRLVGMLLIIYAQTKHKNHIRKVAVDTVGTGILGKMGNKGGVSVRLDIHNTSICFVNAHLAAHVEEFEQRNQNYRDICRRTAFNGFSPPLTIRDHDQVFWLGDLNYRITGLDVKAVKDYIARKNYKPILEYDQLNNQRRVENVFKDFKEGAVDFMPTYKYDVGTDNWDSSEKGRAPAWCDRILWKGELIQQLEYRSHQVYRISDHKPVSAVFISEVKLIDNKKYRKIHEEVMKKLDKLENEFLPQVTVDMTEIKFHPVHFLQPQSRTLTIANNGQVPVKFEFIKKLDDASYCKDWLTIDPYTEDVLPGETCTIRLEVLVDKKSAFKLNSGQDKLYDILVLHLVGGKDIFITVTGEYERSCFGTSLETLAHIPGPIKEVPPGKLVELEKQQRDGTQGLDAVGSYPIPKEVWFLVDHLHRHGMKTLQLFIQSGLQSEIDAIRTWLDHWSLDPMPGSVYSVAEALVLLLESTAEPIIPYEQYPKSLEVAYNYQACKKIVQELPFHKKNVFIYLCLFLRELLTHADDNGLDVNTLATLFGGIFLRDPPWLKSKGTPASKYWTLNQQNGSIRKKASFVTHFLTTDDPHLYQIVSSTGL